MSDYERKRAEALDDYLSSRQLGEESPPSSLIVSDEMIFLEELLALAERHEPSYEFIAGLERHLRQAASGQKAASPADSRGSSQQGFLESVGMNKRILFPIMGVVVAAIVLFIALTVFGGQSGPGEDDLVVAPTETIEVQETPAGASPTAPAPDPDEGVAQLPSPTPVAVPDDLPALPSLPDLMAGGYGGGGGSGELIPPEVTLTLNAALPESPGQATGYWQRDAGLLSVEYVRQFAQRLGLDAAIYLPRVLEASEIPSLYVAVDEPYQVVFEGTLAFYFTDRSIFPKHGGHWSLAESLPPVEEAREVAEAFLSDRGLLDFPYQVAFETYHDTGTVYFLRVLEGDYVLDEPFAAVTLNAEGEVGRVVYHTLVLETLDDYPIISSEEAWEILAAGETTGRIWVASGALTAPPRDLRGANPRYWARSYEPGVQADLFGPIYTFFPVDPEVAPRILMNDLVLTGEPEVLMELAQAYGELVESMGTVEVPMHIWGVVEDAESYRALSIEGWETALDVSTFWTGTVEDGMLIAENGEILSVPDLPADLPDDTAVYVNGGLVGDELEWYLIQEHPADEAMRPVAPPAAVLARVDEVDLVYLAPNLAYVSPAALTDFGYRFAQPAWRFRGTTDLGTNFTVYVQAVADEYRAP